MKNILELNEKINLIKELIPSFDTDERKEIKKNNKIIKDYLVELENVRLLLLDKILEKQEKIIPRNDAKHDLEDNLDDLFRKCRYLSNNNFISKLDFDKNLYEIKYSGSLEKINENINSIIDKFLLIGINLCSDDFRYSISLYKYMDFFLKNKNAEDFNKLISNCFDSLYWECPEIVNHMYLCFITLLDKNSNKFLTYIKRVNDNDNYDDIMNEYYKKKIDIMNEINGNEYLYYKKFLDLEYRIDDYLSDSSLKKEIISKYVSYDKYVNFNNEDRKYFYEQINGMYMDLCEYLEISKYNFLIDRVTSIYSSKDKNTGSYNNTIKGLRNQDKQREKIVGKLFNVYNRLNNRSSMMLVKKFNSLNNKCSNKIMEIIDGYNNYDEVCFVNDIMTLINDESSYYDVFKIYENNYSYLVKLLNENNCKYDDFIDFIYSPYLNISKSLSFVNKINIKDKLLEKYDLFDMNFNLDDSGKQKEEFKYIIRLWNFEKGNIDVDKFKLILNINKLRDKEI